MKDKLKNELAGLLMILLFAALTCVLVWSLCGCAAARVAESVSEKNLNLDGYVMLGKLDMADAVSGVPAGKLIIGRVTCKSRKLAIPADQKVPFTGYFKYTATKSLFGTEERIIEYDFTAGSEAEAKQAEKLLQARKTEAENFCKSVE